MNEILRKIDSLTKYLSINTFHAFDKNNKLTETLTGSGKRLLQSAAWSLTEKIDGTNGRMVFFPNFNFLQGIIDYNGCLLGTRDKLILPPTTEPLAQTILDECSDHTERIFDHYTSDNGEVWSKGIGLLAVYFELFGGNIGAHARNYSRNGSRAFRVFDVRTMTVAEVKAALELPIEKIAGARERNALPGHWFTGNERSEFCRNFGLQTVPNLLAPKPPLPESISGAYEWLTWAIRRAQEFGEPLGTTGGNDFLLTALDRPEGIVIRTDDRSVIVKLRFEDYERALKIHR